MRAPARWCFEMLAAARRYPEWWPGAELAPRGLEGRLRVGSRYRLVTGALASEVEVRVLLPYRRIELEHVGGDLRGSALWELVPEGEGSTRVRHVARGLRGARAALGAEPTDAPRALAEAIREQALPGLRHALEGRPPPDGLDLFEALWTQRAVRRFRPDPVPDAVLRDVLAAATRAPSARNAQPWAFLVLRDPARRAALARVYLAAWERARLHTERTDADRDLRDEPEYPGMMRAVDELARSMADVPVLVLACLDTRRLGPLVDAGGRIGSPLAAYASILPAVQNLMLAARGLGLGTTLTTLASAVEERVREAVGLPAFLHVAALIPLGYPARPARPPRRRPLAEVAFLDRWGEPLDGAAGGSRAGGGGGEGGGNGGGT